MQAEAGDNTSGPSGSRKRKARNFQDEWYKLYPWIRQSPQGGMLCDTCVKASAKCSFTTSDGSMNFQKSALNRHQDSDVHAGSTRTLQLQAQQRTAWQKVTEKNRAGAKERIEHYIKQMRTVYVMVKSDIAADTFTNLMELQVLNGVDLKDYYKQPQTVTEFEECIESLIENDLTEKIKASDFIGIMLDETCDITVHKKLALYVRFINEHGGATTTFIGNAEITDGTAAGIESVLIDYLARKGIILGDNIDKILGLGTDGAAVMTGRLNGLGAKLRRRNSKLIQVHCVAHRLNLAASQAGRAIEYCQQYHCNIQSLQILF